MTTETKTGNAAALRMLFGMTYEVLKRNVDGLTHQDSLIQPEGGGNCLNWVVGHVVATRDLALQLLQQEPIWSKEQSETYRRGSAPIRNASQAQSLENLVSDFDRSQERLVAALARVSDDELNAAAPDQSFGATVGDNLFLLQLHDAYHGGQTGLLRRMAGRPGAIN